MDTNIITLSDHCRFHLGEAPDGIFFSTPKVSSALADCEIPTELENTTSQPCQVTVTNRLSAPDGTAVLELSNTAECLPQQTVTVRNAGSLESPSLWSPGMPYLPLSGTDVFPS